MFILYFLFFYVLIRTTGIRTLAKRDKVDDVVLHFEDSSGLALDYGNARCSADRLGQSTGKYHVRFPASDIDEMYRLLCILQLYYYVYILRISCENALHFFIFSFFFYVQRYFL